MATPINLVPAYNPAFSRGFPPSDIVSDVARNFQGGMGIGLALRGVPQTKLLQENVAQDLDNQLAAALMPLRVQGAGLQNQQAEEARLNAPINRALQRTNIYSEPGIVTNADTGPVVPVSPGSMNDTLRFAAPTGDGQVPSDTISVGVPDQPGVGFSPALRQQETVDKDQRQLERLLAVTNARTEGQKQVAQVKASTGGGLTPYQRSQLTIRAGKVGLVPEDFVKEDGTFDIDEYAQAIGRAERAAQIADIKMKAGAIPAETRNKIYGMQAAREQLYSLQDDLKTMAESSETPSALDNAIAASIREPSNSFFGALYQQGLKGIQSEPSKNLEAKKAMASASIIRALSGLAQTLPEIANSSAFRPTETDDFASVLRKARELENYINREIKGYMTPMGEVKEERPDQGPSNSKKRFTIKRIP